MEKIIRFLNIDILSTTRDELLKRLDKGVLITPNVDHLVKLQRIKIFMMFIKRLNGWCATVRSYI